MSNGQPVQVELFIAGVWVDVTSYCMVRDDSGQISISYGITGGEGSQTERGQAQLQLRNADGRFSPRNPSGAYFGLIGRNTPCRISVPDGSGGKGYRLWGEVTEWAAGWDPTGTDVWSDVTVSGILQRLAQAPAPERSVIYQAVADPLASSVVAYWPCEDPSDATSIASALTSGSPMTITGTPALASYTGAGASDPLPDLTACSLSGGVAKYDDPSSTQVRFLVFIPVAGLTVGKVVCAIDQADYSPGATQFWELYYGNFTSTSTSFTLRTCASDGTNLGSDLESDFDVRGKLLYVSVEFQESGTGITRALRITDVATGTTNSVTSTATLTQLTRVTRLQFGAASRSVVGPVGTAFLPGVAVGHVTVENAITAVDALGRRLNPVGEVAGRRIQRLCGEEGIPVDWVGDLDDTVALGGQGRQNLLALVQESVLADGGLLYENRSVLGLGYRTRASLHGQDPALILDYPSFNLAAVPVPVEDDRFVQNKVTVTVNGVTGTYEATDGTLSTALPPAGMGVYGSDVTLNLATTTAATLRDQAAWRVRLGTVDEARFPSISVNLAHPSITSAMRRAILALRLGDRVQITNPPSWLPPDTIDQLVLGMSETITHFEHRLTFTCAPASPYNQVGVLDSTAARIDTDGSELQAAVSSGATSAVVVPSAGGSTLWTTDTADFPLDVRVGGEVWRVSAITPWLQDLFGRTVSNGWGTADTGQVWSVSGGTSADYAVGSGVGTHTLPTVNASRRSFTDAAFTDFDIYVDVAVSATATGASIHGGPTGRYIDSDNLYMARLDFDTASGVTLQIRKRVNATESGLGSFVLPGTYTPGAAWRVRFQAQGARLRAKAWLIADVVETPEWQVTVTDGDISTTSFIGVRSILAVGNTNVSPVVSYDNLAVVNAQTFTMTRSINGVVKAQTAGTSVSLATPTYFAL
ncbi:hypothetical protein [Streptomyces aureus]